MDLRQVAREIGRVTAPFAEKLQDGSDAQIIGFLYQALFEAEKDRDHWRKEYKELHHDLNCELRDPSGTIWEYARKLQDERDALKKELEDFTVKIKTPDVMLKDKES